MKLNTAQVERTTSQLQIEAIPDDHPLVPQLNRLFGEHTYFLDSSGLNIVEPVSGELVASAASGRDMGVIVNLASWSSSNPPRLQPHEPEVTDSLVALGTDGGQ